MRWDHKGQKNHNAKTGMLDKLLVRMQDRDHENHKTHETIWTRTTDYVHTR